MVLIFDSDEAEGLQNAARHAPHGAQNLCHAMHWTGLCLEGYFYKIALAQRLGYLQQAPGHGNGLKLCLGAPAVFQSYGRQDTVS